MRDFKTAPGSSWLKTSRKDLRVFPLTRGIGAASSTVPPPIVATGENCRAIK